VKRLLALGAEVVFTAREGTNGETFGKEIGATGITLDITNLQHLHDTVTKNGPFDILVNNAGMDQHAFFTKTTMEEWRYLLTVNLESTFATTHAVLPAMQAKKNGRIINISSEYTAPPRLARRRRVFRGEGRGHRVHEIDCP
jgi:2-hydroxycyclohexanecarboxyl-CoA dehydrogenase